MTRQVRLTAEQYDEWQAKIMAQKMVRGSDVRSHARVGNNATMEKPHPTSSPVGSEKQNRHGRAGSNPAPSPTTQRFFVPGRLPGLNDIVRKHHMVYSKLKSEWGLTIARCIIVSKLKRMGYCRIEFVWHEANNRRDDDNVIFAKKFVLDALRDAKIIQDDRREFIHSLTDRVIVDRDNPGVEVTLIPVVVNVT